MMLAHNLNRALKTSCFLALATCLFLLGIVTTHASVITYDFSAGPGLFDLIYSAGGSFSYDTLTGQFTNFAITVNYPDMSQGTSSCSVSTCASQISIVQAPNAYGLFDFYYLPTVASSTFGVNSLELFQPANPTPNDPGGMIYKLVNAPSSFNQNLLYKSDQSNLQASVVKTPITNVPEPSDFGMVLIGLGYIFILRRRKSTRQQEAARRA